MFTVYPNFVMYPLYVDLMGKPRAVQLVNIFGGIYSAIGAVSIVLFGKVVDVIGLFQVIAWLNVPILLNTYLYAVPTMPAEVVAQICLAFIYNVYYVLTPRFCTTYAPPQLFGTMYGVFSAVQGAFQIFLTRFGSWASRLVMLHLFHAHGGPALPYLTTIDVWCFFAVFTSISLLLWWWHFPIPRVGSTTMAHVQNASFGGGERLAKCSDKESAPPEVDSKPFQKQLSTRQSAAKSTSGLSCCCLPGFVRMSEPEVVSGMP